MSVPLFWSDAGLPIGTHLMAAFGDDLTLLQLAAQLEGEHAWADQMPGGID